MKDYFFGKITSNVLHFAKKLKLEIEEAEIIEAKDIKELKNKMKSLKNKVVFLSSINYKLNRFAVENKLVNGLINIELHPKQDFTHFRRAGLDDVLAKFMKEKDVAYVVNFNLLLNPPKNFERCLILGRMMQNIKIANTNKTRIIVTSGAKDMFELKSKAVLKSFIKIISEKI